MVQYDRIALGRQAKELGFVRDTFEKIGRGGMKDNLKIEINYMLLCHVLPSDI